MLRVTMGFRDPPSHYCYACFAGSTTHCYAGLVPLPTIVTQKPDFGLDLYITRTPIPYTNATHKYPFTCAICDRHSSDVTFRTLASVHAHLISIRIRTI